MTILESECLELAFKTLYEVFVSQLKKSNVSGSQSKTWHSLVFTKHHPFYFVKILLHLPVNHGRHGGRMVNVLDSESSSPGSKLGQGHCVGKGSSQRK